MATDVFKLTYAGTDYYVLQNPFEQDGAMQGPVTVDRSNGGTLTLNLTAGVPVIVQPWKSGPPASE